MKDSTVPIFVISLQDSIVRRRNMDFQLQSLRLPYRFLDASNGYALSDEEYNTTAQQRDVTKYKKPFSRGEVGCMHSHIRAYSTIIDRQYEYALILEDDVFLTEQLVNFISPKVMQNLPIDWDIILLAYVQRGNIESRATKHAVLSYWNRITLPCNFTIGIPVQFCYHAAGYLVSQKGAEKLLEIGIPLRMPADILTGNAGNYGLNMYISSKPVIWQHRKWALQSTIKEGVQDSFNTTQQSHTSITLKGLLKTAIRWTRRMISFVLNWIVMCSRGHTFPITLLRKLGIIPPDSI